MEPNNLPHHWQCLPLAMFSLLFVFFWVVVPDRVHPSSSGTRGAGWAYSLGQRLRKMHRKMEARQVKEAEEPRPGVQKNKRWGQQLGGGATIWGCVDGGIGWRRGPGAPGAHDAGAGPHPGAHLPDRDGGPTAGFESRTQRKGSGQADSKRELLAASYQLSRLHN